MKEESNPFKDSCEFWWGKSLAAFYLSAGEAHIISFVWRPGFPTYLWWAFPYTN